MDKTLKNTKLDYKSIAKEIKSLSNLEKAKVSQGFFKTGKGEYGEGDKFLGIPVPVSRKLSKKYKDISLDELQKLLNSKYHEERLTALLILIQKNKKASIEEKESYYKFYIQNFQYINNWDLVDLSAEHIVGGYLFDKDKSFLHKLALSNNLWEKRISILSTFYFIRKNEFSDALRIIEVLKNDKHDLIHKAIGWMLREIGNRNLNVEENFLKSHYKTLPRTALRYAIEKFPEEKRLAYLKGDM